MAERAWNGSVEADLHWASTSLWRRLEAMRIEPEGAALTFTARLARENGWTGAYAEQVFLEYKRFLYLAAGAAEPVTPSDEVDQAWHLHLAYSRHYWEVLCGEMLRRPLHHGPTAGGRAEGDRYRHQYQATLDLYRATFASEPPLSVWPPTAIRFSARPLRIDASRYWLVPKLSPRPAATIGGGALLAACSAAIAGTGGGAEADGFGSLMSVVLIGTALFGLLFGGGHGRGKNRGHGDGSCGGGGGGNIFIGGDGDCGDGDGGGGGCGGCGGCGG